MYYWIVWLLLVLCCLICIPSVTDTDVSGGAVCYNCIKCYSGPVTLGFQRWKTNNYFSFMWKYAVEKFVWLLDLDSFHRKHLLKTSRMEFRENTSLLHGEHPTLFFSFFFYLHVQQSWQNCLILNGVLFLRMMSTESANSFTLIGDASDGGTMENLSRRLKVTNMHWFHGVLSVWQNQISFASDHIPPR